jgi:hypothetical protein
MPISGFFDPSDPAKRPLLNLYVYLPTVDRGAIRTFEIDTGADMTMLSYQDRVGLFEPGHEFTNIQSGHGVSGAATYGLETAVLLAHNGGPRDNWFARPAALWVALTPAVSPAVSLLGRDFIAATKLYMDIANGIVTLDPN